jgi:hypothetical protein
MSPRRSRRGATLLPWSSETNAYGGEAFVHTVAGMRFRPAEAVYIEALQ